MESKIALKIDRDSACMGDDAESHERIRVCCSTDTLEKVIRDVLNSNFLAKIVGGKATWIIQNGSPKNIVPLGVIAQQWVVPRFLVDANRPITDFIDDPDSGGLFFKYWVQQDPDEVFECLQLGKPLPDRYGRK
jgi:hypothetical protein